MGFLRAHRGQSAPPGSTVPGCQTVRVFIVQLLHQDSHLVATPVFWAKVSLRCQDSSVPSQTRGIVFAEHFRRRAAGERCPAAACGLRIPRTLEVIHLKRYRFARITPGRSSLGPRL